jgi:hypothetical protein
MTYDPGMDDLGRRRGRVRSFVLGGLLGASAALATARRARRRSERRETPAGLSAFESAPCYRELLAEEADRDDR